MRAVPSAERGLLSVEIYEVSSTKRDCFGVSMTDQVGLISAWRDIFYSGSATVVGPRISCVLTETV